MASWGDISPSITITLEPVASGFLATQDSDPQTLIYTDALVGVTLSAQPASSNYRLSFSSAPPVVKPTTGQLWPRGGGNIF